MADAELAKAGKRDLPPGGQLAGDHLNSCLQYLPGLGGKVIEDAKLLENIRARGTELREGLTTLAKKFDFIREIRGEGLIIGIELSIDGTPFVTEAMRRGLLINCTHDFTLRLLPPFILTKAQVRDFLRLFESVLESTPKAQPAPAPQNTKTTKPHLAHSAAR